MMSPMGLFAVLAFIAGLAVPLWVAAGYLGQALALAMTGAILLTYLAGARELWRFHQATGNLRIALTSLDEAPAEQADAATAAAGAPSSLGSWLAHVHPSLRQAVRTRIETGTAALPGPMLAPYLTGLLVLLGMLGTFLGMVVTLKGVVLALEGSADLAGIRAALAAPVQGLGLAFGTSVAGVAASAILGLLTALARHERLSAGRLLDAAAAGPLRGFSRARQAEAMLAALQAQAMQLPNLENQMQVWMVQMGDRAEQLDTRLADGQRHFHAQAHDRFDRLASSVAESLREAVQSSAQSVSAAIEPLVAQSLAGLATESRGFQTSLSQAVEQQALMLTARFDVAGSEMARRWDVALERQQQQASALQQAMAEAQRQAQAHVATQAHQLLSGWTQAMALHQTSTLRQDEQRLTAWNEQLKGIAQDLQQAWKQSGLQAQALQLRICETLDETASAIQARAQAQAEQHMGQLQGLIEQAQEAPRVAAEMALDWRRQLSDSLLRDQTNLAERHQLMSQLQKLIEAATQAATDQREAIDRLLVSSAAMLKQSTEHATQGLRAEAERLAASAADATVGAVELASLGDAFAGAVQQFSRSSEAMMGQLQTIEVAMARSTTRSDEQLAYYVAQAREVIDLSLSAQQQIVEDLRRLKSTRPSEAGLVSEGA